MEYFFPLPTRSPSALSQCCCCSCTGQGRTGAGPAQRSLGERSLSSGVVRAGPHLSRRSRRPGLRRGSPVGARSARCGLSLSWFCSGDGWSARCGRRRGSTSDPETSRPWRAERVQAAQGEGRVGGTRFRLFIE